MTLRAPDPGFFVGYFRKVPPAIQTFMLAFGACFVAGLAAASLVLALAADSPGSGSYVDELREGHLTGILQIRPYPVLRVPASASTPARAVMLAGQGKFGVDEAEAAMLDGHWADAGGVFVKRGDLDMLLVGGRVALRTAADTPVGAGSPPASVPRGHWRLTGEICDGKCAAGAMRPGTGLAHKACANLCISGGVPPVFVSTAPVDGHVYFLLADADGGPMPQNLLGRTALRIQLDGVIEQRDDLFIFRVDPSTAEARS